MHTSHETRMNQGNGEVQTRMYVMHVQYISTCRRASRALRLEHLISVIRRVAAGTAEHGARGRDWGRSLPGIEGHRRGGRGRGLGDSRFSWQVRSDIGRTKQQSAES